VVSRARTARQPTALGSEDNGVSEVRAQAHRHWSDALSNFARQLSEQNW
jgi:hypothetical protein